MARNADNQPVQAGFALNDRHAPKGSIADAAQQLSLADASQIRCTRRMAKHRECGAETAGFHVVDPFDQAAPSGPRHLKSKIARVRCFSTAVSWKTPYFLPNHKACFDYQASSFDGTGSTTHHPRPPALGLDRLSRSNGGPWGCRRFLAGGAKPRLGNNPCGPTGGAEALQAFGYARRLLERSRRSFGPD
jgi:hypothetical protein